MGAPGRGKWGHVPAGFRHKIFSHIITVAPKVEIQMQGLNLPAPLDIQRPKMLSASGGLCPLTPLGALPPDPRYRLVLSTSHGAP